MQVDAEDAHAHRAHRHQPDFHAPSGEPLAKQRADADGDGEGHQHQRDHGRPAAQPLRHQHWNLRQIDGAEQPEPRDAEDRLEDRLALPRQPNQGPRLGGRIPAHRPGVGGGRGRDGAARCIASRRDGHHEDEQSERHVAEAADGRAGDGAEQNRHERAHLHHGVAAHELRGVEVLGQHRVLQRPEESGLRSKQKQRRQQRRHALRKERDAGQRRAADLAELHKANQPRLLELVGQNAGGGGKQKERQDEQPSRQIDENRLALGVFDGGNGAVGEEHRQRRLEDVVVERAEKLRHEERPQPPRAKQAELAPRCVRVVFHAASLVE